MADITVGAIKALLKDVPDDYTFTLDASEDDIKVPGGRDRFGVLYDSGRYGLDSRCSELKDVEIDADCKEVKLRLSIMLDER